jgi:hypothetical protein
MAAIAASPLAIARNSFGPFLVRSDLCFQSSSRNLPMMAVFDVFAPLNAMHLRYQASCATVQPFQCITELDSLKRRSVYWARARAHKFLPIQ